MNNISIRRAQRQDIPAIHSLVRDLAIYEKALEELWMTEDDYYISYDKGDFQCIVAEYQGQVIGTCIYYLTFSTWKGRMMYLEDFVVHPDHRGNGAGQLLFDAYLAAAKGQECNLVKWQVLDWNEPAIRFYERNHATIEKEWWNGKIIFDQAT